MQPTPPWQEIRPATAVPVAAYGNNLALACPCGRSVIARSMGGQGRGAVQCPGGCKRWYKGWPDGGARIEKLLVWEAGNDSDTASYAVDVPDALHQA